MTRQTCTQGKSGRLVPLSCLALCVILSGCVSASLEDAAPTQPSQDTNAPTAEERDNSFVQESALRNEAYPTFEKTPVAATNQLSQSDKLRLEAEMDSVRAAYGAGSISEAQYRQRMRELEQLARTHGADTQREIEN